MLRLHWDRQSPNGVPRATRYSFCPLAGECLGIDEQILIPKVLWLSQPWPWQDSCTHGDGMARAPQDRLPICDSPTHHVCPTTASGINCPRGFGLIHSHRSTGFTPVRTLESFVQEILQMGLVTRQAECSSCLWLKWDFQQIQII